MSRGGAVLASLLATIGRPTWWLLGLTGFLVRGGFAVFVVPIVLLPSPLAISNMVAPLVIPVALGRIGPDVVAVGVLAVGALLGWLVVGGWMAAATDLALVREQAAAAIEEGIGSRPGGQDSSLPGDEPAATRRDRVLIGRMVLARLAAWLPLGAAIGIGTAKVMAIAYVELTRPGSVETPLALRVAVGAAPELALVAGAWLLGEIVGGEASRRVALGGLSSWRALLAAGNDVVRRPGSTVLPWVGTTGVLIAVVGGAVGAASVAWSRVIVALSTSPIDPPTVAAHLVLFVSIWLAALTLTGLCAAIRGSVQTFEDLRRRSVTGTFGASAHHRTGDWSVPDEGGSL